MSGQVDSRRAVPRRRPRGTQHCSRCGRRLAADNRGFLCSVCPRLIDGCNPHHDKTLDEKVLQLLMRACPEPAKLQPALGTADSEALRDSIKRLRKRGYFIEGVKRVRYKLVCKSYALNCTPSVVISKQITRIVKYAKISRQPTDWRYS